jgi:hypothetical protein
MANHPNRNAHYFLANGDEVTADQIRQAFDDGKAVLVHSNGDNRTHTTLSLDGEHRDTRGECHSVWDEVWTQEPKNVQQCLALARGYAHS